MPGLLFELGEVRLWVAPSKAPKLFDKPLKFSHNSIEIVEHRREITNGLKLTVRFHRMIPSRISASAGMFSPVGYHLFSLPKSWRAPASIGRTRVAPGCI